MKQFVYRWEPHFCGDFKGSDVNYQRELMMELGEAGWEFVGFVNHWGMCDGRTMLFKREV